MRQKGILNLSGNTEGITFDQPLNPVVSCLGAHCRGAASDDPVLEGADSSHCGNGAAGSLPSSLPTIFKKH